MREILSEEKEVVEVSYLNNLNKFLDLHTKLTCDEDEKKIKPTVLVCNGINQLSANTDPIYLVFIFSQFI